MCVFIIIIRVYEIDNKCNNLCITLDHMCVFFIIRVSEIDNKCTSLCITWDYLCDFFIIRVCEIDPLKLILNVLAYELLGIICVFLLLLGSLKLTFWNW